MSRHRRRGVLHGALPPRPCSRTRRRPPHEMGAEVSAPPAASTPSGPSCRPRRRRRSTSCGARAPRCSAHPGAPPAARGAGGDNGTARPAAAWERAAVPRLQKALRVDPGRSRRWTWTASSAPDGDRARAKPGCSRASRSTGRARAGRQQLVRRRVGQLPAEKRAAVERVRGRDALLTPSTKSPAAFPVVPLGVEVFVDEGGGDGATSVAGLQKKHYSSCRKTTKTFWVNFFTSSPPSSASVSQERDTPPSRPRRTRRVRGI